MGAGAVGVTDGSGVDERVVEGVGDERGDGPTDLPGVGVDDGVGVMTGARGGTGTGTARVGVGRTRA